MTFHVSPSALDWALAHIQRFGDTDIFPKPFEFEAIQSDWASVKDYLCSRDLDQWLVNPARTCLTPKGRYSYRVSTQLDPLDSMLFAALTYEVGGALESSRVRASEPVVFSHRFSPSMDGEMYDRTQNWLTFQRRCEEIIDDNDDITHVVIADISDFFPRLYHHRIENALKAATGNSDQARILTKLLGQWSNGTSYGIPVGPSASRLIADITIDDVDRFLLSQGQPFCRYSDDFRIFCTSLREAYDCLASLADASFQIHGLTLQAQKTAIVTRRRFRESYLSTPETQEQQNLSESLESFLESLGLENMYDEIDYDDLEENQQELIDSWNLQEILQSQLDSREMDTGLVRFVLRRLTQLNDPSMVRECLKDHPRLYLILPYVVEYVLGLREIPGNIRERASRTLLNLFEESSTAHLPYHRSWLLMPFASRSDWDHHERFVQILGRASDTFTRRKAILALGRSRQSFWFRARRSNALSLEPWERRAFLAGTSCLANDERNFWYRSIKRRLSILEQTVIAWACNTGFS